MYQKRSPLPPKKKKKHKQKRITSVWRRALVQPALQHYNLILLLDSTERNNNTTVGQYRKK